MLRLMTDAALRDHTCDLSVITYDQLTSKVYHCVVLVLFNDTNSLTVTGQRPSNDVCLEDKIIRTVL